MLPPLRAGGMSPWALSRSSLTHVHGRKQLRPGLAEEGVDVGGALDGPAGTTHSATSPPPLLHGPSLPYATARGQKPFPGPSACFTPCRGLLRLPAQKLGTSKPLGCINTLQTRCMRDAPERVQRVHGLHSAA